MNTRHLKHDYYTDVITFDYSVKGVISGEVYISIDRVRDNAIAFSCSPEEELRRVMIHGVLHMCGYGDKTDEEANRMRILENEALNVFVE